MKLIFIRSIASLMLVVAVADDGSAQQGFPQQGLHRARTPSLALPKPAFETSWLGYDTGSHSVACWPYAARVGDLDGDGRPDLAVVNWWAFHKLSILRNQGDGCLAPPVFYDYAKGAQDLVIADFNADGKPDVAVSNYGSNGEGNTVSLFTNLGGGSFAAQVQFAVGTESFVGPVGLAAADFDGDGRDDLAVALYGYIGQGTQVAVLTNDGASGFLPAQAFTVGTAPYKLAAGDLDGDGRADIVVARDYEHISVLRNTGLGFAPAVSYPGLEWFNFDLSATVELCDVDRDGDLDILYGASTTSVNTESAIALLRNQGAGTFAPAEALFTVPYTGGAIDLATGDINGDGWPDVLGAGGDQRWSLFRGDGGGGFRAAGP